MEQGTRTALALVLMPFMLFALRFGSRAIVEMLYRVTPEGWLKDRLARDRASRKSAR